MAVASVEQNDIEHAAAMDNVDRAAKYLQDIAGITTGDVASHYLNEEKLSECWEVTSGETQEFDVGSVEKPTCV
jgi:hypothetical protein